ncbi:TIGR03086 family protein [Actinophytocola xinjiangensis]|uniref:TIGR03086 family protein n=2 Tax=Actinophytocola xinjiangensis TaxID=485602 RepID=A0A7Z0WJP8_9PSEU|nr:TIGR03086 family protein [Actinophytocola xinjiangensis]
MATTGRAVLEIAGNVKPDQLGLPSPCPDWDVRAVVNHLMFWSAFRSELAARKESAPADDPVTEQTDFTAEGDWFEVLRTQLDRATQAWSEPGALDGDTGLAGGSMPAPVIAMMMVGELVLHGWDLAAATGQRLDIDDATARAVYESTAAMAEQGRSYGAFGEEVPVPADASPLDRVLGLSGRDPSWKP